MRSVICDLDNGGKIYAHRGRAWLSKGFECGLARGTFMGLIRRGLILPRQARHLWGLSRKGRQWARLPWNPRQVRVIEE